MDNSFFKLYPNVIPVRGYNRSMLLDLYFGKFYLIPNSLVDILNDLEVSNKSLSEFIIQFDDNDRQTISEYFEFITDQNLGLKCDETLRKSLGQIESNFRIPFLIENVIFEIDSKSNWLESKTFDQLENVLAKFLEIRFLDSDSFYSNIEFILTKLENAYIESVEVLIPFSVGLKHKLNELIKKYPRLWKITVYNSVEGFELESSDVKLFFTKQNSIEESHCGNISQTYFSIDTQSYIRNINYNNCTAFKLSINKTGIIKNCPSNEKNFGHISETDLYSLVIDNVQFKETWGITKDLIDVCKDCEYRLICSDCRVFIDDKSNINSRPSKCNYNPYISKWEGEPGYQNLVETGVTISDHELIIDHEKIATINRKMWN